MTMSDTHPMLESSAYLNSGPFPTRFREAEARGRRLARPLIRATRISAEVPVRPPWAYPGVLLLNVWRYQVIARLPGGRRRLERWGLRVWSRNRRSYRPVETGDVGSLPE